MPNVMVSEGGPFGRYLGHEGEAPTNGITVLIKEAPESSLAPPTIVGTQVEACDPYKGLT